MEAFSTEQREYLEQRYGQVMAAMAHQAPSDLSPAAPEVPGQPHGDNGERVYGVSPSSQPDCYSG